MKNTYPTLAEAIADATTEIANTGNPFSFHDVFSKVREGVNNLSIGIKDVDPTFMSPTFLCYVPFVDRATAKDLFRTAADNLGLNKSFNGTYWEYSL